MQRPTKAVYAGTVPKLACSFIVVGLMLVMPPLAAASETDASTSASDRPRFELALSLEGAASLEGGRCTRELSDVVGCSGLAYGLLSVAPGVRLNHWLSLAVVNGIGLAERATLWQLTAEARVHPLGAGTFDPSFGFDAGLIQLFDRIPSNEVGPAEQVNNLAGTLSVLAEAAWQLTDAFALHLQVRARYLDFPRDYEVFERVSYRTTWLAGTSLGARYRW